MGQHCFILFYPFTFLTYIVFLYSEYEAEEHSAQEVKKEVEMHLTEKDIIEATIPSNIVIGPFWINTDSVKQNLAKKRKALSNAVLELLARKLRKQADDVSIDKYMMFSNLSNWLIIMPSAQTHVKNMLI